MLKRQASNNREGRGKLRLKLPWRGSISLQGVLVSSVLLTVSVTAVTIHLPWLFTSRRNTLTIVNRLNREIVRSANQTVASLFESTLATQQTIHTLLEQDAIDLDDPETRDDFYLTLLQANPQVSWLSFGYPNGDFFGVQRQPSGTLRVVNSEWDAEAQTASRQFATYEVINAIPTLADTEVIEQEYYAPQRSWYRKAIAYPQQNIWTDVYIFNTSRKPGINSAITLEDEAGELVGVVTIAIELERIATYLNDVQMGKTGSAFILNAEQELIVFSGKDDASIQASEDGTLRLRKLWEAENPLLQLASQSLTDQDIHLRDLRSLKEFTYQDPTTGDRYFISFAPLNTYDYTLDWFVGTIIPASDFLADIERNQRRLLYAIAGLTVITAGLAVVLTRKAIAEPLLRITEQAKRIQTFRLTKLQGINSAISEIDQLSNAMEQMRVGLSSFQRYLPTELVQTLIGKGIVACLGGEERVLTIFFIDIVAFTKTFEQMGPAMIPYVGEFYELMSHKIVTQGGTIDKYIGDCIMAFWGAPLSNPNHAVDACRAALECQHLLETIRPRWQSENKPPFYARIGINTGSVLVGNIGCEKKMDYTVIGDPVNASSRIEGLNKIYGTEIIIGPQTYELAKDHVIVRKLDTVAVYGKEEGLEVYELLAMADRDSDRRAGEFAWVQTFEAGVAAYQNRHWETAIHLFKTVINLRPGGDRPSQIYLERCTEYMQFPPQEDWAGITILDQK
ncbi:MAG: adenylate/guanylate cyclase domain-containing protein [Leptolyngbyaceae cyanobacterium]